MNGISDQIGQSFHHEDGEKKPLRQFQAASCLLGAFDTVIAAGKPASISTAEGRVWIDPPNRCYRSAVLRPDSFFATPSRAAQVERSATPPDRQSRPVEEILWQAAWFGSQGALLDRCSPLAVVELLHWPNLARLPHDASTVSLCALIHQRSISISFAFRLLKVSAEDACRFLSAADAAGLIQSVGEKSTHHTKQTTGVTDRVAEFWGRLFQKLTGL